jgi:alpha-L-rhamnosidase
MNSQRFAIAPAALPADNNVRHQYPIHSGKWVKHPDQSPESASFCRYTLSFELDAPATIKLHVSADNRFELTCDGQYIGMGPDRSDIDHWSFHSYALALEAGTHELVADVHYLGLGYELRPCAQTCIEPGFILYAEDSPVDVNTGSAPWQVTKLEGVGAEAINLRAYMVVGPNYTIDAAKYFNPPAVVEPVVIRNGGGNSESGLITRGWKLYPTRLPEQTRDAVVGGKIRCVTNIADDQVFPDQDDADAPVPADQWQKLVEGQTAVTVPPNTRMTVLWDLDEYRTAYPQVTTSDGAGSKINLDWAESCYVNLLGEEGKSPHEKRNRDEIAGKYFRGNGDAFVPDGQARTFRAYWWRAGRYVRITVQTADQPLTIEELCLLESRMPLENESVFKSSDAELEPVIDVAVRGIQMCSHETYMDCPYYEQMMYVGDTRLQMLTSYVMSSEDRLNQRSLEIFDWSRQEKGFVLERCPSQPKQLSCTFSMVWALMLRDYAWWRADEDFLQQRMKGLRCMLEEFKALPDTYAPLLPPLPGWSFMDWVGGLSRTDRPVPEGMCSALTNLLFLNALCAAAELENTFGEPHLAQYNRDWAKRIAMAIDDKFWVEQRALFADDLEHTTFSEHAQCLALLSGMFSHHEERCFESLITADDLTPTTVYFSFYLLETLAKFGRGDLLHQKLDFWKQMLTMGFKTPVEMPEPSRSDCHAWGSHPLFHMHASLAGIRPDAPCFAKVRITPQPGSMTELSSTIPHPKGEVSLAMKLEGQTWQTQVSLPAGIEGTLVWRDQSHPLKDAMQLTLPAS